MTEVSVCARVCFWMQDKSWGPDLVLHLALLKSLHFLVCITKLGQTHKDTGCKLSINILVSYHWGISVGHCSSWRHTPCASSAIILLPFHSKLTWQGFFCFSWEARPGTPTPPTYSLLLTTVRGIQNFNKTKCLFPLVDLLKSTSFNIRTESAGEIESRSK